MSTDQTEALVRLAAERLVALHEGEIRYSSGSWFVWTGTCWGDDGCLVAMVDHARRALKSLRWQAATNLEECERIEFLRYVDAFESNWDGLVMIVSWASEDLRIRRPAGWVEGPSVQLERLRMGMAA